MNNTIKQQLEMLKTLEFEVDGVSVKDIPESFSEIVFKSTQKEIKVDMEKTFIFEDYMIKPFKGFDFHDKFNQGVPPPEKTMKGIILKETEKMYYVKLSSYTSNATWIGWTPKKSVRVM